MLKSYAYDKLAHPAKDVDILFCKTKYHSHRTKNIFDLDKMNSSTCSASISELILFSLDHDFDDGEIVWCWTHTDPEALKEFQGEYQMNSAINKVFATYFDYLERYDDDGDTPAPLLRLYKEHRQYYLQARHYPGQRTMTSRAQAIDVYAVMNLVDLLRRAKYQIHIE